MGDDEVTVPVTGYLHGAYSACGSLLYLLADECAARYRPTCDALFAVSA
ncbi:hypothetical protein [Modestobacter marinus]|nr:hypothetical protein [Modestobacter marinus]